MLREEAEASDRTALQAVVDRSMEEIARLEAEEVRVSNNPSSHLTTSRTASRTLHIAYHISYHHMHATTH